MTLTTTMEVFDPNADPEALFGALREAIGVPPEQGIHHFPPGQDGEIMFMTEVGGYPAATIMTIRPSPPDPHWDYDEWDSGWIIRLSLDTAGARRVTFDHHLMAFGYMVGKVPIDPAYWRIYDENRDRWLQRIDGSLVEVAEPEEFTG